MNICAKCGLKTKQPELCGVCQIDKIRHEMIARITREQEQEDLLNQRYKQFKKSMSKPERKEYNRALKSMSTEEPCEVCKKPVEVEQWRINFNRWKCVDCLKIGLDILEAKIKGEYRCH